MGGDEDIRTIASHLGMDSSYVFIEEIVAEVRRQVAAAVRESRYDEVKDLEQLRRVICDAYEIELVRLEKDEDLATVAERHSHVRDGFEQEVANDLEGQDQLGAVYGNKAYPDRGRRWLAAVDARGQKEHSAEFTRWHEIAHVLTGFFNDDDGAEEETDTVVEANKPEEDERPLGELIVDRVASMLLYWQPFWEPDFAEQLQEHKGLTFELIEHIRQSYASNVSFYSCAIQCVQNFHLPCLLVRVDMGLKASERRKWEREKLQPHLGFDEDRSKNRPVEKLRLVERIGPEAPKIEAPVELWRNVRVPAESVLREVFEADQPISRSDYTDQSEWETSGRGSLPSLPLYVEAKQFGPNTLGLIQPNWNKVRIVSTQRLTF